MPAETLLDCFDRVCRASGTYVVHDDGFRIRSFAYSDIAQAARSFACRLGAAGLHKRDRAIIWAENRPGWIIGFWGCVLAGVTVVPLDAHTSPEFVSSVANLVRARLLLIGEEVQVDSLSSDPDLPRWSLRELESPVGAVPTAEIQGGLAGRSSAEVRSDDIAEIIFTSGATAEPKGVLVTHGNLTANLGPVEQEVQKYRKYGRAVLPLGILNLLPLSHLFGQTLALFIPPMLPAKVVFVRGNDPGELTRRIKTHRISVLVCVPKVLQLFRQYLEMEHPEARNLTGRFHRAPAIVRIAWRWWRYRRIHRRLGWQFWALVVGAAPLDPELESFWGELGYLVVQGYGLTEAAPIVTLNHPFNTRAGSVGKPLPGIALRIAPDGEVLVRGRNVSPGCLEASGDVVPSMEAGWLHTGDIGELDAEGRLYVRGRKKEMIVTAEGFNVHPEDVERVLNAIPGVRESAVIGSRSAGEEQVHAVVTLESGGSSSLPLIHPAEILRLANSRLAEHQKIKGVTVWTQELLPRTEGLGKLKRTKIREMVESLSGPREPPRAQDPLDQVLEKYIDRVPGQGPGIPESEWTLDQLGLSSLERVELAMALEARSGTPVDEEALARARSIRELCEWIHRPPSISLPEPIPFPGWSRSRLVVWTRNVCLAGLILPLTRLFAWIRTEGTEHLESIRGPVILAANHQSHLDTPAILAALPSRLRYGIAPAMSKDYFAAHFQPRSHPWRKRLASGLKYVLAVLFFSAFPLPQRESGVREALRYIGELASKGVSILIFPEGERSTSGGIQAFRPGVAMMAVLLDLPVVPVRLEGLDRVLHPSWRMARPGPVQISFGSPMKLIGADYAALARQVENAVRGLTQSR